jgi:hypothetical protein
MASLTRIVNKFYLKSQTVISPGLSYYVDKMSKGEIFTFSRFGDGEWAAILRESGKNCDGHEYYPELGQRLRKAVNEQYGYMYAFQPFAMKAYGQKITRYLKKNNVKPTWHYADVFHHANSAGELFPLVNQLRAMNVVMVGPDYLKGLPEKAFPCQQFIEIPSKNCFLRINDIQDKVIAAGQNSQNLVFAFSASMMTKAIIHEVFPVLGGKHWLIDFGSLWDIYAGVKSRTVYSKLDWTSIIKKNLGV